MPLDVMTDTFFSQFSSDCAGQRLKLRLSHGCHNIDTYLVTVHDHAGFIYLIRHFTVCLDYQRVLK